jgi:hypothetical protein
MTIDVLVLTPDDVETEAGRCPECGCRWTDDGPAHAHECRYFLLDEQDPGDEEFLPGEPAFPLLPFDDAVPGKRQRPAA